MNTSKLAFLGGIIGGFEDIETERPTVKNLATDPWSAFLDLGREVVGLGGDNQFNAKGSLEFNRPDPKTAKEQEAQHEKMVYHNLEEARKSAQNKAHEAALDMQARFEVAGMPTPEKNQMLHLNMNYSERNISDPYHTAALYREVKASIREQEAEKQSQELTAATETPSLINSLMAQEGQSLVSSSGAIAGAG